MHLKCRPILTRYQENEHVLPQPPVHGEPLELHQDPLEGFRDVQCHAKVTKLTLRVQLCIKLRP